MGPWNTHLDAKDCMLVALCNLTEKKERNQSKKAMMIENRLDIFIKIDFEMLRFSSEKRKQFNSIESN